MARKFTILKVLTQLSSKGFTLIELLISTTILVIIMGLAMDGFINANKTFNDSNRISTTNQNLSSILEYVGNDVRLIGEGLDDNSFPAVEFAVNTDTGSMSGSSKLILRRLALPVNLSLCQDISATSTPTNIIVADATLSATHPNCDPTLATGTISPSLPTNLRLQRNYRCQLDLPDPNWQSATTDACSASPPAGTANPERLLMAVSDRAGHFRRFSTDNEVEISASQYGLSIALDDIGATTLSTDSRNMVSYPAGSPIYTLEERIYSLDDRSNLNLSVNGSPPIVLLPNVERFNIKGKIYTNITDKLVAVPTSSNYVCATDPNYVCRFNANTSTEAATQWKTIGGIHISLQSKYDATGKSATPSAADLDRLTVSGQYFPRNSMSSD